MLQVRARSPDNRWMRQPGGPSTPSMSAALMREARMLRILTVRSGRIPLVSSSSTSRLSPLWRILRIFMPERYGIAVQTPTGSWRLEFPDSVPRTFRSPFRKGLSENENAAKILSQRRFLWLRGWDLNLRPSGYEGILRQTPPSMPCHCHSTIAVRYLSRPAEGVAADIDRRDPGTWTRQRR